MLSFLFLVFLGHITIVLSQDAKCTQSTRELMTCVTPCNDDPNNVTTLCFERKIAEFLFKDHLYTDKTAGDVSGEWLSNNCKCIFHLDKIAVQAATGGLLSGCSSNLNAYLCTNKFPQCTIKNLQCRNQVTPTCLAGDKKFTTFPQATVVCLGNPTEFSSCKTSAYIIPSKHFDDNGQKLCSSCTFTTDQVIKACTPYHYTFKFTPPALFADFVGGSAEVAYCPSDLK